MMAEAKAIGALAKTAGAKRTLVYLSWDAEEPMLLGSTEWAETPRAELKQKGLRLHQHRRQRARASSAWRATTPSENFVDQGRRTT